MESQNIRANSFGGQRELPCLVLGNGITALGVIRSLGQAGVVAYSVSPEMAEAEHSRWFRRLPSPSPLLSPGTRLDDFLRVLPIESAVLIPCSDHYALEVAALSPQLAERFPSVQPGADALAHLIDKAKFASLLNRLAVLHPYSYAVSCSVDFNAIPDEFFSCSFLKPRDSQAFFRHYGQKAFRVFSREEATQQFERFRNAGFSMLFQEYIPGPPTNHFFIDGYVARSGEIVALFPRQRIRMYPQDFGNSTYMTSVSLSTVEAPVASLRKIFTALNYRGIFSAEFKRDARDGSFRILEINARPWWFIEFATRCRVNVAELLYGEAIGAPASPVPRYAVGKSCVNLYYDWHAAQAMVPQQLSWAAVLFTWIRAKKSLFRLDDPLPSIAWLMAAACRRVNRTVKPQPPVMQPHQA